MKHSQRGYSLIELSIVLAIIAVIIAGAVSGVQAILRSNSVVNTVADSNKAVNRIIAKMVRNNDYSEATTVNLSSPGMDVWDAKYVTDGGKTTASVGNAFGGRIYVAALSADENGLTANQAFVYTLPGIPSAACTDVALGLDALGAEVGIKNELASASTTAKAGVYGTAVKKPGTAIKASAVTAACSPTAGDAGQTTITVVVQRT